MAEPPTPDSTRDRPRTDLPRSSAWRIAPLILTLAAFFALAGGLAEGALVWARGEAPVSRGFSNSLAPEMFWIAPLVDLTLLLGAALGLLLLVWIVPARFQPARLRLDAVAVGLFAWLAVLGAVMTLDELSGWSKALLALGVVVQAARFVMSRPPLSYQGARRRLLQLGGVALVVNLAALAIGERRGSPGSLRQTGSLSGLASLLETPLSRRGLLSAHVASASESPPNVLLVVLDTLRADHLSAHGYARQTTPHLDRFAAGAALFESAMSTACWTMPAHASMMTGRYLYEHQTDRSWLNERFPTLAEHLRDRGYATAAFVATAINAGTRTGLGRGFQRFQDYYANPIDAARRTAYGRAIREWLPALGMYGTLGRKDAARVSDEFLVWLESRPTLPFFAFLNYMDVHDPYLPPPPYDRAFTDNPTRGDRINSEIFGNRFRNPNALSPREIESEVAAYDGGLAYLDVQLGLLFDRLTELGLLDNTVVIVTSDHGEGFGGHGFFGHTNSLYRELLHVPLILRYPRRVAAGTRVSCPVSLTALPATVLELLRPGEQTPFPARPLTAHLQPNGGGAACAADVAYSESVSSAVDAEQSVTTHEWHWIVNRKAEQELYRVDRDPMETQNLADSAEGRLAMRDLEARLAQHVSPEELDVFVRAVRARA